MLSRIQKVVLLIGACLVLIALACMYPVQSVIIAVVVGKGYLQIK